MANSTTFLPKATYQHIEGKPTVASNTIDFTKENVAISGTIDVLNIPKGALVKNCYIITNTTEATVTVAVGDQASATQFLTAAVLGSAGNMRASVEAARKVYTADNTVRLTIAAAKATAAKITVVAEYIMVPSLV